MKHRYDYSGTDPPNPSFRTRTARKNRQSDEVKGKTQISPEVNSESKRNRKLRSEKIDLEY